jgi:hypothetical protein
MIYYLEYNDWNNLKIFIAEIAKLNFLEILETANLPIRRTVLNSWSELPLELAKSEDIFAQASNDLLVDIADLKITKEFEKVIPKNPSGKIIFYSSIRDSLSAEEKKLVKKHKVIYEKLNKMDLHSLNKISQAYIQKNNLELNIKTVEVITKKSSSVSELLDNLDYMDLADDKEAALKELAAEPPLPIFMLPFRSNRIVEDTKKWKNKIKEEEIQLGLSLIFGKLEKNGGEKAKKMISVLVETDKVVKTRGGVSPNLWWKLFLWKCKQAE